MDAGLPNNKGEKMKMMTNEECKKTIGWLQEFIFKLEDRPDHEAFQEQINKLKASANELQERLDAWELGVDIPNSNQYVDQQ